jgi:hypothetical protein
MTALQRNLPADYSDSSDKQNLKTVSTRKRKKLCTCQTKTKPKKRIDSMSPAPTLDPTATTPSSARPTETFACHQFPCGGEIILPAVCCSHSVHAAVSCVAFLDEGKAKNDRGFTLISMMSTAGVA